MLHADSLQKFTYYARTIKGLEYYALVYTGFRYDGRGTRIHEFLMTMGYDMYVKWEADPTELDILLQDYAPTGRRVSLSEYLRMEKESGRTRLTRSALGYNIPTDLPYIAPTWDVGYAYDTSSTGAVTWDFTSLHTGTYISPNSTSNTRVN